MFRTSIVAVLEADKVSFVKCPYVQSNVRVQIQDRCSVFNDEHELCLTLSKQIYSQAFLIFHSKFIASIGAKFAIVRRVQEYEVICLGLIALQKDFKVHIFNHSIM